MPSRATVTPSASAILAKLQEARAASPLGIAHLNLNETAESLRARIVKRAAAFDRMSAQDQRIYLADQERQLREDTTHGKPAPPSSSRLHALDLRTAVPTVNASERNHELPLSHRALDLHSYKGPSNTSAYSNTTYAGNVGNGTYKGTAPTDQRTLLGLHRSAGIGTLAAVGFVVVYIGTGFVIYMTVARDYGLLIILSWGLALLF